MPTVRLVDIKSEMPTCIKSTQSTRPHALLRPRSNIPKTKESNSVSHVYENADRYSTDIRQLQNSLAEIYSRLNQLAPLTHIWGINTDKNLEQLTKAECILDFVAEEVTKRMMSSHNAVVYNLPDRIHPNKLRDICLKACDMLKVNCQVIRLRKKSDRLTCPLLFKFGCCNDAKQFIDLSKNISSLVPYKSIKVTPDLTPCQRRIRRREAIESYDRVIVKNQLKTVCNEMIDIKRMDNKHDVIPQTTGPSVDLDESADLKSLNKIRSPSVTKRRDGISDPGCSLSIIPKCGPCNETHPTKHIHVKIGSPRDTPQEDSKEPKFISQRQRNPSSLTKKTGEIKSKIRNRGTRKIEANCSVGIPTTVNRFYPLISCNLPSTPRTMGSTLERNKPFYTHTHKNYQNTGHSTHLLKSKTVNNNSNYRFLTPHPMYIPQDHNCNYSQNENFPVSTHHMKTASIHNNSRNHFQLRASDPPHARTSANSYNRGYELNHQNCLANNSTLYSQHVPDFFGIRPLVAPLLKHIALVISNQVRNINSLPPYSSHQKVLLPFPPG
uniref:Uncharacterized protein n=1 Tax=Schistosoma mansoni TaxID=6183 RepID=Q4QQE7_SCHMA|nr:TPA: hypothetical protein [Schistosoma mansoni]